MGADFDPLPSSIGPGGQACKFPGRDPNARTCYDDLPEISPWRQMKWSSVYRGKNFPLARFIQQVRQGTSRGLKRIDIESSAWPFTQATLTGASIPRLVSSAQDGIHFRSIRGP